MGSVGARLFAALLYLYERINVRILLLFIIINLYLVSISLWKGSSKKQKKIYKQLSFLHASNESDCSGQ